MTAWTPGQMIPEFENKLFTDIYDNVDDFLADYNDVGIPTTISNESATILFYLLYAKYGNSPISNSDETQFKYKLFSLIFQHGPIWEKRLSIQEELRNYSIEKASEGAKSIYNHAMNDSSISASDATVNKELPFINDQTVSKYSKASIEGASLLWDNIKGDITEDFLRRFRNLFYRIVRAEHTYIYTTVEEDSNNGSDI